MKLSKKLRILIIVTVSVLLIAGGVMSFFAFHFYIPLDRQIRKMIYIDYYDGNHYLCPDSSGLYEIEICGYEGCSEDQRSTDYSFRFEEDNITYKAVIEYPGTPQKQYYSFPRLSKGEKFILITGVDLRKPGRRLAKSEGYYLFLLQEIDGVEYAYPCIIDLSMVSLTLAGDQIPFKYVYESRIYDSWDDADVCDLLEKNGQKNPEYQYKLRADDLRSNYRNILYQGRRSVK